MIVFLRQDFVQVLPTRHCWQRISMNFNCKKRKSNGNQYSNYFPYTFCVSMPMVCLSSFSNSMAGDIRLPVSPLNVITEIAVNFGWIALQTKGNGKLKRCDSTADDAPPWLVMTTVSGLFSFTR